MFSQDAEVGGLAPHPVELLDQRIVGDSLLELKVAAAYVEYFDLLGNGRSDSVRVERIPLHPYSLHLVALDLVGGQDVDLFGRVDPFSDVYQLQFGRRLHGHQLWPLRVELYISYFSVLC